MRAGPGLGELHGPGRQLGDLTPGRFGVVGARRGGQRGLTAAAVLGARTWSRGRGRRAGVAAGRGDDRAGRGPSAGRLLDTPAAGPRAGWRRGAGRNWSRRGPGGLAGPHGRLQLGHVPCNSRQPWHPELSHTFRIQKRRPVSCASSSDRVNGYRNSSADHGRASSSPMGCHGSSALGWGGISAVATATGLSRNTIAAGVAEIGERSRQAMPVPAGPRVRRPGGGESRGSRPTPDWRGAGGPGRAADAGHPESPLRWTCKSRRSWPTSWPAGPSVSHRRGQAAP